MGLALHASGISWRIDAAYHKQDVTLWAPAAQHGLPADAPAGAIKIVGFLKVAFLIYRSFPRMGAAEAQAVRHWRV